VTFSRPILRLARTNSSIGFHDLFSENGVFLVLNDWLEDQGFVLKQRATEALTMAFKEIPQTDAMELLRAGFVSRLAAVYQAMECSAGVAETADSILEWTETIDRVISRGERLVSDLG
jgi:hypothetical protein